MERLQALLAANQAFYDAFEGRDRAAMSALWEHSDRATCTHPGWPALRGWPAVAASWEAILGGPRPEQFVLTDLRASIVGEAGWVALDENLLGGTSTVSAINLFVDAGEGWRMVAHHASPVLRG